MALVLAKGVVVASLVVAGLAIGVAGCARDAASLCAGAGGAYAAGTCIRWSPGQQAAQDGCEANGGVYMGGNDTCEFGMGGP